MAFVYLYNCNLCFYAYKAWRICKIFDTTTKMKKIVIKDLRLIIYIILMVAIDVIVLVLWQLIDTVKLKSRYVYEIQTQLSQIILPSSYSSKYPQITSTISNFYLIFCLNNLTSKLKLVNKTSHEFDNLDISEITKKKNNNPIISNFSQTNQLKLIFECSSNYNEVWITILTMYKIILLMYGIYLAWIIRYQTFYY
jgi:hypothetical protein